MSIQTSFNAPLVISDDDLKAGVNKHSLALLGYQRHRAIVMGRMRAQLEANNYLRNTEVSHLSGFRDNIIGNAILIAIRSVACRDEEHRQLTNFAERYWRYYKTQNLVPPMLPYDVTEPYEPEYQIAGHLGSLAFYVVRYDIDTTKSWLYTIRTMLIYFWQSIGIQFQGTTVRERHRKVLEGINFDREYIQKIEAALIKMHKLGNKTFRRYAININEIVHLPERILMGDVKDAILDEYRGLQAISNLREEARENFGLEIRDMDYLDNLIVRQQIIGYSGGLPLMYQAFILEGYYQILSSILSIMSPSTTSTLSPTTSLSYKDISIKELATNEEYEEERIKIGRGYALIADGFNCLHYTETLEGMARMSKVARDSAISWLATTSVRELELSDENRLGEFIGV